MDLNALIAALEANTAALIKDSEGFITQIKNLNGTLTSVGKERILKEREYFDVFKKSGVSFTDSVRSLTDGIKVGIRNMTKPMADLVGITKRLNLNTIEYQDALAFNTQVVKLSEEATYKLINENIALGQRFNRHQAFMVSLLGSLQETAKILSLTSKAGTVQDFLTIGQTIGAALGPQFTGIGQFLNKMTGTTLAGLSNLARIGAKPVGGNQSQQQLVDGIFEISERVNVMSRAVEGLSFSPELFQRLFGFAAEDIIIARSILAGQTEIRNSLKTQLAIQDNELAISKNINEITLAMGQLFSPIVRSLLESINASLTRLMPRIIIKVEEFANVIKGWNLDKKIPEWFGIAVGWIEKIWDWLENRFSIQGIVDSIVDFGYRAEEWGMYALKATIDAINRIYDWISTHGSDVKHGLTAAALIAATLATMKSVATKGAVMVAAGASTATLGALAAAGAAASLAGGFAAGGEISKMPWYKKNVGNPIEEFLKGKTHELPTSFNSLGRPDLMNKAEKGNEEALQELIQLHRDFIQVQLQTRDLLVDKGSSKIYGPPVWANQGFKNFMYMGDN